MAVNRDKPDQWKADIAQSVDLYNDWFLLFATRTSRAERNLATMDVEDVFPWLADARNPKQREVFRAGMTIADRLCGASADPILRNAHKQYQLAKLKTWLVVGGYSNRSQNASLEGLVPGEFAYHLNAPGLRDDSGNVNVPIDAVVMAITAKAGEPPLMIEAKSAGDFRIINRRRKEEAATLGPLWRKHGSGVRYVLFLCGHFDTSYLGYEAGEGIDWVWEHHMDDLIAFGL